MLFPVSVREEQAKKLLEQADVDGTLRPFQLSIEEFDRIVQVYKRILDKYPAFERYDPRSEGGHHDVLLADVMKLIDE